MDLPMDQAARVKEAVERLMREPRGSGIIKLEHAPVAQYRLRLDNWRVLFDFDDKNRIIEILDIRKRDERTYK